MMYFKLRIRELFSSEWVNNAIKRYVMFQGLSQLEKIRYLFTVYKHLKKS